MVVRTIFNLLGPLINPAGAKRQLLGVYDARWVVPIANVLKALGSKHVMVVHSDDGLDEISIAAPTLVAELKNGEIREYKVEPGQFDCKQQPIDSLRVGNSNESLKLVHQALQGSNQAAMDMVVLNAGAAIHVAGKTATLGDGVEMARDAIGNGLAMEKLKDFVDFTRQVAANG